MFNTIFGLTSFKLMDFVKLKKMLNSIQELRFIRENKINYDEIQRNLNLYHHKELNYN